MRPPEFFIKKDILIEQIKNKIGIKEDGYWKDLLTDVADLYEEYVSVLRIYNDNPTKILKKELAIAAENFIKAVDYAESVCDN